jgi:hypothetical protein
MDKWRGERSDSVRYSIPFLVAHLIQWVLFASSLYLPGASTVSKPVRSHRHEGYIVTGGMPSDSAVAKTFPRLFVLHSLILELSLLLPNESK